MSQGPQDLALSQGGQAPPPFHYNIYKHTISSSSALGRVGA